MAVEGYRNPRRASSAGLRVSLGRENGISWAGLRSSIGECFPRNRERPPSKDRTLASVQLGAAAQKFGPLFRRAADKPHSDPAPGSIGWSWDDRIPPFLHGQASAGLRHSQRKPDWAR